MLVGSYCIFAKHVRIQRENRGSKQPSEKSQSYLVPKQYWYGSPGKSRATKPASNVGPPSARQRQAIEMDFNFGSIIAGF